MAGSEQPASPDNAIPDHRLLSRIAGGDVDAFDALYQRHWHALLTYLVGQLNERPAAEEVLQDVMLAVWNSAAHFRGDASVRTWLYAIARRQALQRRHRAQVALSPLDEHIPEARPLPGEVVEQREHQAEIHAALKQLPTEQQEIIELIFYHGLTGPEVASVTGVALGTVKSRLRRAKKQLLRVLRLQEIIDA